MTTVHAREISDLLALAGVDGAEEGYYDRLRVEDGELIESLFTPTGTDEKTVATDVHQDTPASYLVGGTEKLAFCVDESYVLQSYSFEIGADQWNIEAGSLGDAGITVHPDSKLASGFMPAGVNVFFQDEQGNLNATQSKDLTSWSVVGRLSSAARPIRGTALQALPTSESMRLFYINQDKHIHYLESSGSGWKDHKVEYANLGEGQPGRFIVAQDDDAKAQFLLLNNHNSVVHINSEKQTIIGKINFEGGKKELELTIKEECFYWFWPLRPVVHMSFTKIEINAGRDAVMTGVTDGIK